MARLLRMPEVAANVEEAVLQEWAVAANVPFAAQDAIAVVETDKAVVEVPAPEAGVILTQLVGAGEVVAVGTPIAVLGGLGEQVGDLAGLLVELGVADPAGAAGDDAARAGETAGSGGGLAGVAAGAGEVAGSGDGWAQTGEARTGEARTREARTGEAGAGEARAGMAGAGAGEAAGSGGGMAGGELAGSGVAGAGGLASSGVAGAGGVAGSGVTGARAGEAAGSGGSWVVPTGGAAGAGREGGVGVAGMAGGAVARTGDAADAGKAEVAGAGNPDVAAGNVPGGRKFASPLARRMAKEAGLAIEEIVGTGPGGRVVRRDIEAALAHRRAGETVGGEEAAVEEPEVPAESVGHAASEAGGGSAQRPYSDVPHSRVRLAIASRLTESVRDAPHFYLRATVRVDKLMRLRARLDGVSVNDLLVKAAGHAHLQVPAMNVIWTSEAVRCFESVDIAVAVATDRGLVTPVVREVERRSVSDLARATRDLAERARKGQLRQHELEGGTLTISNLGMYGTEEFSAIINPPHAAILAVGAARREVVVKKGHPAVATVIRCTLSVDHRPVDGVTAAQWLDVFVRTVEHPLRILS